MAHDATKIFYIVLTHFYIEQKKRDVIESYQEFLNPPVHLHESFLMPDRLIHPVNVMKFEISRQGRFDNVEVW